MNTPTPATEIIKAFLLANPHLPSRTIARKLYEDHAGMWPSIEAIRTSVRAHRGASGDPKRGYRKTIAPPSPLTTDMGVIERNPFYCPPSDEKYWKPYFVSVPTEDKTLLLSDPHFPYHNVKAITSAIGEGKRQGVSRIILNGDTIDFYQISRFNKDPRMRQLVSTPEKDGELDMVKDFLYELRDHFPTAEIIWKDGNHDERLFAYLMAHAKELIGLESLTIPALLDFLPLRIEYVTDKRPILLGKNNIIHGHEYPMAVIGPVNPARGLFLRAKTNAVCGHHHQVSEHSEPNLKGELIACWSTGCLCELHPPYMPLNKWAHGFAIQTTAPDGSFEMDNKKIIDGKIL